MPARRRNARCEHGKQPSLCKDCGDRRSASTIAQGAGAESVAELGSASSGPRSSRCANRMPGLRRRLSLRAWNEVVQGVSQIGVLRARYAEGTVPGPRLRRIGALPAQLEAPEAPLQDSECHGPSICGHNCERWRCAICNADHDKHDACNVVMERNNVAIGSG